MKKSFLILTAVITLISTAVQAGANPCPEDKFKSAFNKYFPGIAIENVTVSGNITILAFVEDKQERKAYFDSDAQLIAITRFITTDRMPLQAVRAIKERFGDFGLYRALEVSYTAGHSFYCLDVLDKGNIKRIKVDPAGSIIVLKK